VATVWDDENADGLEDIHQGQELIAKQGLAKPRYAILEKSKFDQLQRQKAVARRLFPRADQALVTADMITLQAINTYMVGKGWPSLLVLDSYATVEAKDGTRETVKPWNENVVALSPEARLGYTYYKPVPTIANTSALQVQGSYYKMTRYSEVNPLKEVTTTEAYVQPALSNRRSLVFINTAAQKWNDGKAKS
jgi:hypothetical protein